MLTIGLLGLGIGMVFAGTILLMASILYVKRMRNPVAIRLAAVAVMVMGLLLGVTVIFWQ